MTAAFRQTLEIPATDGFLLTASRFRPEQPNVVVVVAAATGVRRRLYRALAEDFAGRGFGVLALDYRGTGDSRPGRVAGLWDELEAWMARRDANS